MLKTSQNITDAYPILDLFLGRAERRQVTVPNADTVLVNRSSDQNSIYINFPPLPVRGTDPEVYFDPYRLKPTGELLRYRGIGEGALTIVESGVVRDILEAVLNGFPESADEGPGHDGNAREAILETFRRATRQTIENIVVAIMRNAEHQICNVIRHRFRDATPDAPMPLDLLEMKPGMREGLCDTASYIVCDEAVKLGHHLLTFGKNNTIRLRRLTTLIEPNDDDVFRHTFSIVCVYGRSFLVDRTVCQFIGSDGAIGSRLISNSKNDTLRLTGRNVSEYPVLQALLKNGFVEWSAANLVQYLQALTLNQKPEFQHALEAAFDQYRVNGLFTEVDALL